MWNRIRLWLNKNDFKILTFVIIVIGIYFLIKGMNNFFKNEQQAKNNNYIVQNTSIFDDVQYKEDDLKEIDELKADSILDTKNEVTIQKLSKGIDVNNISFRYPNVDKWVIKNLSMHIEPNTSVALIGASGAGKSTLADIILGVLEPQMGMVEVEGVNIKENLSAWHKCIGYIPQTIYLMDDTIRSNIAFGLDREQINEEALWNAIRGAQLEQFVKSLPDGLETVIEIVWWTETKNWNSTCFIQSTYSFDFR